MRGVLRVGTRLRPCDSPSQFYAAAAAAMPTHTVLVFGPGVWRQLRQELHSVEAIGKWATDLATRHGRPVLLNVPAPDGSSHTLALSPPGWSPERLQGYVAGRHEEIAAEYGPIAHVVRGAA